MNDDAIAQRRAAAQPDAAQASAFRAYARGRQRGTLTSGQQRILRGLLGHLFCDNVCHMALSRVAARVSLARFTIDGDDAATAALETWLRAWWVLNQFERLSAEVQYAALRDGNHGVALEWRDGRVVCTREPWWNGTHGLWVAYDDLGRPEYAVKEWERKRTVWYPDRIERYQLSGDGWQPRRLDGDASWPVPWRDARGAPLGLPVVHIAAFDRPNDGDAPGDPLPYYGMSLLDGGVLGLQDEINDVQRDLSAAARFAGYQMLYGTGIQPVYDEAGNEQPIIVEPGAFFRDPSADARFGALPAGSLAELERTLTVKLQAVSRMTGVPQHLIAGDWPSGEALLRAEQPLVDKATTLAGAIGPAWASLAHKATRLANVFGGAGLDETLLISAVFDPVDRRDPLTLALIAEKRAPFVSRRETLRTLGYAPREQDRILAEMDDDRAQSASLGQTMLDNFNSGV